MWTTSKKFKTWIRVIAAITLFCFVAYDITWAYPPDNKSTPETVIQQTLFTSNEKAENLVKVAIRYFRIMVELYLKDMPIAGVEEKATEILKIVEGVARKLVGDEEANRLRKDNRFSVESSMGQVCFNIDHGDIVLKFFFPGYPDTATAAKNYEIKDEKTFHKYLKYQVLKAKKPKSKQAGKRAPPEAEKLVSTQPARTEEAETDEGEGEGGTEGGSKTLAGLLPAPLLLAFLTPDKRIIVILAVAGLAVASLLFYTIRVLLKKHWLRKKRRSRGIVKRLLDEGLAGNILFDNAVMGAYLDELRKYRGPKDIFKNPREAGKVSWPHYESFVTRLGRVCREIGTSWNFSNVPLENPFVISIGNGLTIGSALTDPNEESIIALYNFLHREICEIDLRQPDSGKLVEIYQVLAAIRDFNLPEEETAAPVEQSAPPNQPTRPPARPPAPPVRPTARPPARPASEAPTLPEGVTEADIAIARDVLKLHARDLNELAGKIRVLKDSGAWEALIAPAEPAPVAPPTWPGEVAKPAPDEPALEEAASEPAVEATPGEIEQILKVVEVVADDDNLRSGEFFRDAVGKKMDHATGLSIVFMKMMEFGIVEMAGSKFRLTDGLRGEPSEKIMQLVRAKLGGAESAKAGPQEGAAPAASGEGEKGNQCKAFEAIIADEDLRNGKIHKDNIAEKLGLTPEDETVTSVVEELVMLRILEIKGVGYVLNVQYRMADSEAIQRVVTEVLWGLPDKMNVSQRLETAPKLQLALAGLRKPEEDASAGEPASAPESEAPVAPPIERSEPGATARVFMAIMENDWLRKNGFTRREFGKRTEGFDHGTIVVTLSNLKKLEVFRIYDTAVPKKNWKYNLDDKYRDASEETIRSIFEDESEDGLRRAPDNLSEDKTDRIKEFLRRKIFGQPGSSATAPAFFMAGILPESLNLPLIISVLVIAAAIYFYFPFWWKTRKAKKLFHKYIKAEGKDEKRYIKDFIEAETDFEFVHHHGDWFVDPSYDALIVQEGIEVRERTFKFADKEFKVIWTDYTDVKTKLLYLPFEIVSWTLAIIAIIVAMPFLIIFLIGESIYKDNPFRTLYRIPKARKALTEFVTLRDKLERGEFEDPFRAEMKEEELHELKKKWDIESCLGEGVFMVCDASIRVAPGIRMLYGYDDDKKKNVFTYISLGKYERYHYKARWRNAPIIIAVELYRLYRKTMRLMKKMGRFMDKFIRDIPVIDKKIVNFLEWLAKWAKGEEEVEEKTEKTAEETEEEIDERLGLTDLFRRIGPLMGTEESLAWSKRRDEWFERMCEESQDIAVIECASAALAFLGMNEITDKRFEPYLLDPVHLIVRSPSEVFRDEDSVKSFITQIALLFGKRGMRTRDSQGEKRDVVRDGKLTPEGKAAVEEAAFIVWEIVPGTKGDILNGFNAVVEKFVKKDKAVEFTREDFRRKRKKKKETFSYTTITSELEGMVKLGILTVDRDFQPYKYQVDEKYLRGPPKTREKKLGKVRTIIESENLPAKPNNRRLREVRERIEDEAFTEAEKAAIIESKEITDRKYKEALLKDEPVVKFYIELLYSLNLELYALAYERINIEDSIAGITKKLQGESDPRTRGSLRARIGRLTDKLDTKKKKIRNLRKRAKRRIRNFKKMKYSGPAIRRYEDYRGKAEEHFREAVELIGQETLNPETTETFRSMMRAAINNLNKDRRWLLERRLDRKRKAKRVTIDYKEGKYILVEGRYVGKGAPILKKFRTAYRYLWDAFRATDHKIDSEDENLSWITPVIGELKSIRNVLREHEKTPSSMPDQIVSELTRRLNTVLKQLKGVKVEEKRFARINLSAVVRLLKIRKIDTARGLLTNVIRLIENRRNSVEDILENIKKGSLTELRREVRRRNRDIKRRATKIFTLLKSGKEESRIKEKKEEAEK
ncbi:MAG: hypothetical protein ACE5JK_03360, partial [Candidatus Omnitrophota bacterium]